MTQLATAHTFAELLALPDDGKIYELVRGEFVEKPMGRRSVGTASEIQITLGGFVKANRLGSIATELPINCFPWLGNHGRRPDVCFFDWQRLPEGFASDEHVTVAPNWVAEVLSEHDNAIDVDEKLEEYLQAGVELIWIVNPAVRTVRVHRADGSVAFYHEADTIDGGTVFPNFRAKVHDLFPQPMSK
ncbi:MAG TPA: Uma2 family endonuclease [Tepidisphaeraceae bacterium]|jgi:Uma2 family endonuclease|nr:Uma2 family endonuclease [Tepidisphaeraceae bacterium]